MKGHYEQEEYLSRSAWKQCYKEETPQRTNTSKVKHALASLVMCGVSLKYSGLPSFYCEIVLLKKREGAGGPEVCVCGGGGGGGEKNNPEEKTLKVKKINLTLK